MRIAPVIATMKRFDSKHLFFKKNYFCKKNHGTLINNIHKGI